MKRHATRGGFGRASRPAASRKVASRRLPSGRRVVLKLYVLGNSSRSIRAILDLRRLVESHLPGRCTLQIVDIYKSVQVARNAGIMAAPTLVKHSPGPSRRLVGDLSNDRKVLAGLGLPRPRARRA